MENLDSNDISFLVALLASEESNVNGLKNELEPWGCNQNQVLPILTSLISDGTIGVTKSDNDEFIDFETKKSLNLLNNWQEFIHSEYQLYLTDEGYKRWDTDDWGITTKRAQYLMFSNKGSNIRIGEHSK